MRRDPNDEDLTSDFPESDLTGLTAFSADPAMISDFIAEAREHFLAIEHTILLIEHDASNIAAIDDLFRVFHTLKGLAGFLELDAIQEIAHAVEDLLDLARTQKLVASLEMTDAIFQATDFLRHETDRIEQTISSEGIGHIGASADRDALLKTIRDAARSGNTSPASGEGVLKGTLSEDRPDPPSKHKSPVHDNLQRPKEAAAVRIETAKLDHLMNMVGELVIAQTLVSHNPLLAGLHDPRLTADLALLTRVTADIQRISTSMRMVAIGIQFQKTARLVRDLSRQVGKQVALVMNGEDTQLDKRIAEELADPLLHMVRNSIDHGIETPDHRAAAGKDPVAMIRLAAYHQGDQIVIEISDDGRGLNREKILAKAKERGLTTGRHPLSDSEVFHLIFEPGFSTAEQLTGLSGRGVGMDVVKQHVEKLRGRIEIESTAGKGTTFFLRLPLTLAIIEGLIVSVCHSRYIVPLFSILEILRPDPSAISNLPGREEMASIRGILLPVIRLSRRFKQMCDSRPLSDGMLVVSESEGKRFCLFVDDVLGKQEVVIKSLGGTFKDISGLAGCAVLSDGRVGLILDTHSIYRAAA